MMRIDYLFSFFNNKMRRNKREGFQFSFGLKQHQEPQSSRSTPKFPSIQISKINLPTSQKKPITQHFETQPIQIRRSPSDLFRDIGGGIQLMRTRKSKELTNQRAITLFTNQETQGNQSVDNKSIKSARSLGERVIKRHEAKGLARRGFGARQEKQSSSLANILELRLQSPSMKKRQQSQRQLISFKNNQSHFPKNAFQTIEESKNHSQDTLKLEGSFFENSKNNLQFRETKKMADTFQKYKTNGERERSKVFKNFMHKVRPTLRLGTQRPINANQKIQSISRKFEEEKF